MKPAKSKPKRRAGQKSPPAEAPETNKDVRTTDPEKDQNWRHRHKTLKPKTSHKIQLIFKTAEKVKVRECHGTP